MNSKKWTSQLDFVQLTFLISKIVDNLAKSKRLIKLRNQVDKIRLQKYIEIDENILKLQSLENNMFALIEIGLLKEYSDKCTIKLGEYDIRALEARLIHVSVKERKILQEFLENQINMNESCDEQTNQEEFFEYFDDITTEFMEISDYNQTVENSFGNIWKIFTPKMFNIGVTAFMVFVILFAIYKINLKNVPQVEQQTFTYNVTTFTTELILPVQTFDYNIFIYILFILVFILVVCYIYFQQRNGLFETNKDNYAFGSKSDIKSSFSNLKMDTFSRFKKISRNSATNEGNVKRKKDFQTFKKSLLVSQANISTKNVLSNEYNPRFDSNNEVVVSKIKIFKQKTFKLKDMARRLKIMLFSKNSTIANETSKN